jgi:hypothetical protein
MTESKASRTLLKSPPELWSEVSTATSLQRHMDQFGEIRITKLEPETAVAWEGEHARGTITLEVSGWGTRVSLTAEPVRANGVDGTSSEAVDVAEPEPADDSAESEVADDLIESEVANDLVESVVAGDRVEPELADDRVKPEAPETVDSPDAVAFEMPHLSPERDDFEARVQRPRWTRRLARAFEKWFGPARLESAEPVAQAPELQPAQRAAWPVVAREPARPTTPVAPTPTPTPVAAEPKARATTTQPPIISRAPAPEQGPPPEVDAASTAALDAALESLGQAHHRPFSRA